MKKQKLKKPTNIMHKNGPKGPEVWHSFDGGTCWTMVSQKVIK